MRKLTELLSSYTFSVNFMMSFSTSCDVARSGPGVAKSGCGVAKFGCDVTKWGGI
jgi:hypothetical protein